VVTSQWQSASDEDWALALARAAVIRPLSDQGELTEGLVATASTELGISRSLVYRLVAKFRKRPQVSSLLPGKRGRKAAARALISNQLSLQSFAPAHSIFILHIVWAPTRIGGMGLTPLSGIYSISPPPSSFIGLNIIPAESCQSLSFSPAE